ncbi:MAG TPA: class I SAM-dependent methyltransferase [Anaerolineae bacterium]|nr:class I SAM-dependent methyltransferase [Anaerolineae bacterium]
MPTFKSNRIHHSLAEALWKIYHRPDWMVPMAEAKNLPWHQPDFSERMLREHLDESHGAASRIAAERAAQLDWLWTKLDLQPGMRLLDVTCGPGLYAVELACRGCLVTGVDFSPAAIAYAKDLALSQGVAARCTFIEQDVRGMDFFGANFDAAIFLYGQLAVFTKAEAQALLGQLAGALKPGGKLGVELLNQDRVDKTRSEWWFTDDKGLWGDGPFLHLGERLWYEAEEMSLERFYIIHLETGELTEISLSDQTYAAETMTHMLDRAGFAAVEVYESWDHLPLYDADEWLVYVAHR